jgi:hypothetical protein
MGIAVLFKIYSKFIQNAAPKRYHRVFVHPIDAENNNGGIIQCEL